MTSIFSKDEECISPSDQERESWPDADMLADDLSVHELNSIHEFLSIAGSLGNISAISHQHALLRTIVPTNHSRLHLCWVGQIIYIKPLPNHLLNADYVNEHAGSLQANPQTADLVRGILRSYCSLILSPLDLAQAKNQDLIDGRVEWAQWQRWRAAVLGRVAFGSNHGVNRRYYYGELRLSRINWIWRFKLRGRAYFTHHREYTTYFAGYFHVFLVIFAFVTTVLQGIQVALAAPDANDKTLEQISDVVVVMALVMVFLSLLVVGGISIPVFIYNAALAARAQWEMR